MLEESQNDLFSTLGNARALCKKVNPTEITWLLQDGIDELEISTSGSSSLLCPGVI